MKEIKFRAWYSDFKIMVTPSEIKFDEGIPTKMIQHEEQVTEGCPLDIQKFILMQYAGLKDKNGKEIYEGDIVTNQGRLYQICYEILGARFWFFTVRRTDGILLLQSSDCPSREKLYWFDSEIIGNIYENPELLKEK